MKKFYLLAICAVTLLCSCNKETGGATPTVADSNESKAITFGLETPIVKSVAENTVATVKDSGFNVAGVTSDNTTLFNALASWVEEKEWFSTAQTYYYPTGKTMSFYAAVPSAVTVSSGAASIEYTNNVETDLIVASKTGVSASSNKVNLVFDHILSQVDFTAIGSDTQVTYKVTSIKVSAPATGTYTFSDGKWTKGTAADVTYLDTAADVSTEDATPLGEAQTFLPVELTVTAEWECYSAGALVSSYKKSADFTPTQGNKCTVNLTLPNSAAQAINFVIDVNPWGTENKNITLE